MKGELVWCEITCHFYRSLGVRVKQQGRPHKQKCRHFHFESLVAQVAVVHIGAGVFLSPLIFPPCSRGTGVTVSAKTVPTDSESTHTTSTRNFPCSSCGSYLEFEPGQQVLQCPHCGHETPLEVHSFEALADALQELDYKTWLARAAEQTPQIERQVVTCPGCDSITQLPQNVVSAKCPFCVAPLLAANAHAERQIQPRAMVPFQIDAEQALQRFQQWVKSLKYAPVGLKKSLLGVGELKAVYLPFWTFDSRVRTEYSGERGKRSSQNTYSFTKGKWVQETSIRWVDVSETFPHAFDDVLVPASRSVPVRDLVHLEPWDLSALVPYSNTTILRVAEEIPQLGLQEGFVAACDRMELLLREMIKKRIWGDFQRINSMAVYHRDITFKLILLPLWVHRYRYRDFTWHCVVNGQTGQVYGLRPQSGVKIAVLIASIYLFLLAGGAAYAGVQTKKGWMAHMPIVLMLGALTLAIIVVAHAVQRVADKRRAARGKSVPLS